MWHTLIRLFEGRDSWGQYLGPSGNCVGILSQSLRALTKLYFLVNVTKVNNNEIEILARMLLQNRRKNIQRPGGNQEKLRMGNKDKWCRSTYWSNNNISADCLICYLRCEAFRWWGHNRALAFGVWCNWCEFIVKVTGV